MKHSNYLNYDFIVKNQEVYSFLKQISIALNTSIPELDPIMSEDDYTTLINFRRLSEEEIKTIKSLGLIFEIRKTKKINRHDKTRFN